MEFNDMYLVKTRYTKQINDIWEQQKEQQNSTIPQKKVMSEKNQGYNTKENGGGSRHSLSR